MKIYQKKQFNFECKMMYNDPEYTGSNKIQFYIGESAANVHPLNFQNLWILEERLFSITKNPMNSLWKLKEIADENNVNFLELVCYAFNYPTGGEKPAPKPEKPTTEPITLEYDIRISEEGYSNELKALDKLLFSKKEGFVLGLFALICVDNKSENFLAELYKLSLKPKKLLKRYENMTYQSAIILDCYGKILHPKLYNALVANYYTSFEDYKKYIADLRKSLEAFAKVKVTEKFELIDVKKMQKNLLKVL
jgi:hypothetical protein